jgi:acyl phosphate:glycerol-3-phosphate acyltransferase
MPIVAISFSEYAIIAAVAYLLGSIPFGYLLVKTFTGADVRAQGSGNIGATNVARTGKKGLAILTLVLDALKGYAAVWFALKYVERQFGNTSGWTFYRAYASPYEMPVFFAGLAALFAVIGHMYPVWLKFKGGKGVATALGVYLALAPKAIVVSIIVFFLVFAVTRYVSLGSILASLAFPVAFWYFHRADSTPAVLLMICAIQALIIWKHADNIRRLASGTESKFGAKKAGAV